MVRCPGAFDATSFRSEMRLKVAPCLPHCVTRVETKEFENKCKAKLVNEVLVETRFPRWCSIVVEVRIPEVV